MSLALNYGEAQGAESRQDFTRKIKMCNTSKVIKWMNEW
jgi:hypothetical protein